MKTMVKLTKEGNRDRVDNDKNPVTLPANPGGTN